MGIYAVDIYSIGHFIGGILSRLVIFPSNKWLSFSVGTAIHILIEIIEKKFNPILNKTLETGINNIFDIIFFLIGWFIADYNYEKYKLKGIYYIYFSIVLYFGILIEVFREIFPYNKFLGGAYVT